MERFNISVEEYVAELKSLAQTCSFGQFLDAALRDKLVCRVNNEAIQQRFLNEGEIDFSRSCALGHSIEMI